MAIDCVMSVRYSASNVKATLAKMGDTGLAAVVQAGAVGWLNSGVNCRPR